AGIADLSAVGGEVERLAADEPLGSVEQVINDELFLCGGDGVLSAGGGGGLIENIVDIQAAVTAHVKLDAMEVVSVVGFDSVLTQGGDKDCAADFAEGGGHRGRAARDDCAVDSRDGLVDDVLAGFVGNVRCGPAENGLSLTD